jgi:hypothetical protein
VVAGGRAVGDAGRGTWRGAELKASRGAGDLGKARPRAAHSADAEAARCRCVGGAALARARHGIGWPEIVLLHPCLNA